MGKHFELFLDGKIIPSSGKKDLFLAWVDAIYNKIFPKKIPTTEHLSEFNTIKIKIVEETGFVFNKKPTGRFVLLSPLQLAARSGDMTWLMHLMNNATNRESLLTETIKVDALSADEKPLLFTIDNVTYVQGASALHLAVLSGNVEVVQALLKEGAINSQILDREDAQGNTPLHLAAKLGHIGIVDCLVLKGAKTAHRSSITQQTPLEYARLDVNEQVYQQLKGIIEDVTPNNRTSTTSTSPTQSSSGGSGHDAGKSKKVWENFQDAFDAITLAQTKIATQISQTSATAEAEQQKLANYKAYLEGLNDNLVTLDQLFITASAKGCNVGIMKQTTLLSVKGVIDAIKTSEDCTEGLTHCKEIMDARAPSLSDETYNKWKLLLIAVMVILFITAAVLLAMTGFGLAAEVFLAGFTKTFIAAFTGNAVTVAGTTVAAKGVATTAVLGSAVIGGAGGSLFCYKRGMMNHSWLLNEKKVPPVIQDLHNNLQGINNLSKLAIK